MFSQGRIQRHSPAARQGPLPEPAPGPAAGAPAAAAGGGGGGAGDGDSFPAVVGNRRRRAVFVAGFKFTGYES